MKNKNREKLRRILIIDDNHLIHGDFHKIFAGQDDTRSSLREEASALFGDTGSESQPVQFMVNSAYHGQAGAEKVKHAVEIGLPYAMVFVDMRMPRGWNGVETVRELWQIDPHLQVVICTAYSDFSWKEMLESIVTSDRLVILKKPFEPIEAIQLANMLTEKWTLQREARKKMESLEDEVSRRTDELQNANLDLQRRNNEIQYLYHTLSHELKTPLTAAKEFISIVMDGLAGDLNGTQREYLDVARQSCDRLGVYINDLFDAARLDTGKMTLNLRPVSLSELIRHVMTIMQTPAKEKGINLHEDMDSGIGEVMVDEPRIAQVLINLYNNALKFTPRGGSISVSLYKDPDRPDWVNISVADTGRGIAKEQINNLFQRFYQIESTGLEQKKGVGLGLYLCRQLLRFHNGDIQATSELGKGSVFKISLPMTQPATDKLLEIKLQSTEPNETSVDGTTAS